MAEIWGEGTFDVCSSLQTKVHNRSSIEESEGAESMPISLHSINNIYPTVRFVKQITVMTKWDSQFLISMPKAAIFLTKHSSK